MVNILIPSCNKSEFFEDSFYPKTLYEIKGMPMIQLVSSSYNNIKNSHFIFMFLQDECDKFHNDKVVSIMTNNECDIIKLRNVTKGALCSCLMAIDYINNDDELIISNNDQFIDADFNKILDYFRINNFDCGVICFESLHPRWSYVRLDNDEVIEAAEKRPISNKAIAGFYYFKHGKDFIEVAKNAIRKGNVVDGKFYLTSSINEMILLNKRVGIYEIENNKYNTFYTPEHIRQYEKRK